MRALLPPPPPAQANHKEKKEKTHVDVGHPRGVVRLEPHPPLEHLPHPLGAPQHLLHVRVPVPERVHAGQQRHGPVPDVARVRDKPVAHLHLGVLDPRGHVAVVDLEGALPHGARAPKVALRLLPRRVLGPGARLPPPHAPRRVLKLAALVGAVLCELLGVGDDAGGRAEVVLELDLLRLAQDLLGRDLARGGRLVLDAHGARQVARAIAAVAAVAVGPAAAAVRRRHDSCVCVGYFWRSLGGLGISCAGPAEGPCRGLPAPGAFREGRARAREREREQGRVSFGGRARVCFVLLLLLLSFGVCLCRCASQVCVRVLSALCGCVFCLLWRGVGANASSIKRGGGSLHLLLLPLLTHWIRAKRTAPTHGSRARHHNTHITQHSLVHTHAQRHRLLALPLSASAIGVWAPPAFSEEDASACGRPPPSLSIPPPANQSRARVGLEVFSSPSTVAGFGGGNGRRSF